MPYKMLFASVLALLSACGETTVKERQAAHAEEPIVERSAASEFDPDDTQQEVQDKAEARGAAQALTAIQTGDSVDRNRKN